MALKTSRFLASPVLRLAAWIWVAGMAGLWLSQFGSLIGTLLARLGLA